MQPMQVKMSDKICIKTKNMSQLVEYRNYLRRHPKLTYLFVELTDICNMSCIHCGSDCEQGKGTFIDSSILLRSLREISNDFPVSKVMICLTGGEPLIHPDFFEIVNEVNKLGFSWGMTTNGTLISDEIALELKKSKIGSITLSIDGVKDTHNWFRNREGSYELVVDAIKSLHKVGIEVQVTTVVHKRNISELDDIYKVLDFLNVESWRIVNIEPIGRAQKHNELMLDRAELIRLLDYIRDKRFAKDVKMDVRFGCSHYLSFEYEHEVRDNYFLCGAGIYVGSILCNGDIYGCLDIERRSDLVQGNIKNDRFYDVWMNRFSKYREDRSEKSEQCRKCKEREFCNADSLHTWNFDQNKPMMCMLKEEI